jgi:hypothetical protein
MSREHWPLSEFACSLSCYFKAPSMVEKIESVNHMNTLSTKTKNRTKIYSEESEPRVHLPRTNRPSTDRILDLIKEHVRVEDTGLQQARLVYTTEKLRERERER